MKIGFIGFGKMAQAIWLGIVASKLLTSKDAFFYDVNKENTDFVKSKFKLSTLEIMPMIDRCDYVFVCVKPQNIADLIEQIRHSDSLNNTCFVSILAGIPISTFKNGLGAIDIIRIMPNTPAMVNEGMSVLCTEHLVHPEKSKFIETVFESFGKVEVLPEELIDIVTAISGSGPAYFYKICQDIVEMGIKKGLNKPTAIRLAAQTMKGAAEMLLSGNLANPNEPADPIQLINQVTSPGGTTLAGLNAYTNANTSSGIQKTIEGAYDRSIELKTKGT
ncbi:pyrroline-5-carboxylate reductase [bacterium]|jgi:pyrroline-5-carboxylate reductase|nr:pyrroline-5-carboxylate reductase [bacterium]